MCPDTSRTEMTTCSYTGCSRRVWQDPDGSFSLYCSKNHRDAAVMSLPSAQVCQHCKIRPVYIENGRAHNFCGVRCATAHKQHGGLPAGRRTAQVPSPISANPVCGLSSCDKAVFVNRSGQPSNYCSQGHRVTAVATGEAEACLKCARFPKATINSKLSDFCSIRCRDDTFGEAPCILEIDSSHAIFTSVVNQFNEQWRHLDENPEVPVVHKVWKIFASKPIVGQFDRYRLSVERRTSLEGGNSIRRWHGTVRACNLGDEPHENGLCQDDICSLCCIIRTSFQLAQAGKRTNFGRFGAGIYTSATSSKAHDYVAQSPTAPSSYEAILLNDVVVGKTKKLTVSDPSLIEPPAGFDSVTGEPGGDLNYDECIVYKNDAIRPLFLVVYHPNNTQAVVRAARRRRGSISP
ncbi:hypothetical protein C8Q75DRAFT_748043 [Abortiporus biennis]|nr:hypothetical protein C8Q75DRAFT_748043 [Abortiporus biennis]